MPPPLTKSNKNQWASNGNQWEINDINEKSMEHNGHINGKHMKTMEINEITEAQSQIMKIRRTAMHIRENNH